MDFCKKIIKWMSDGVWKVFSSPFMVGGALASALVLVVIDSMLPPGLTGAEYQNLYGERLAELILFLELDGVYQSWLFLLCGICLGGYLLTRVLEHLASREYRSCHLPLSIFLIMIGGYLEGTLAVRGYMRLSPDEYSSTFTQQLRYGLNREIMLPFALKNSAFKIIENNKNGSPIAYISQLDILYSGIRSEYKLELGSPLVIAGYSISQSSYYYNENNELCAIVEVATHPGKYLLAIGGALLLVAILILLLPGLSGKAIAADNQQPPDRVS